MSRGVSIRWRLVFALAGVSLFTLLVVGTVFYLFLGDYVLERQRDLLLDQAIEVAEQVEGVSESWPVMTEVRGRRMVGGLLRADLRVLPAGAGIVVFSNAAVIAKVGVLPHLPGVLENLRAQAERVAAGGPDTAVVRTALGDTGREVAALVAVAPVSLGDSEGLAVVTLARSDAFGYRSGILRTLLVSGGIAVLLSIILGWVLGIRMTKPLRRLSEASRRLAIGSYQQPVTGSYPGEIQELAEDLESMRQEVRRSEDSLRGFVSSAAHELRTPLTSIQGFSQALLDGTAATGEERSRSAAAIYRESTRLRRLVDTLLTLSRYDSHEFRPSLSSVCLADLVAEEVDRLVQAGMAESGRIVVRVEGDTRAVTDADMLRQVIGNLLRNAVQYGNEGPVEVSLARKGAHLLMEVANGGDPLGPEERARLFSRFYRGRAARHKEGFGLGLALVWEICELLGGKVELAQVDELTRFRVTLPAPGAEIGCATIKP